MYAHSEVVGDDCGRLASTLRLVGLGTLVLAGLTSVLAFTGYETPRPVNVSFLLIAVNLFMLGGLCLQLGRMFGRASGEAVPPRLTEALRKANTLFGYGLILVGLAVVGVGVETVVFLARIAGR